MQSLEGFTRLIKISQIVGKISTFHLVNPQVKGFPIKLNKKKIYLYLYFITYGETLYRKCPTSAVSSLLYIILRRTYHYCFYSF